MCEVFATNQYPGLPSCLNHNANIKYFCHNAHCIRGIRGLSSHYGSDSLESQASSGLTFCEKYSHGCKK